MRSKRRKQKGVGEWMVAQMVIPVFISPFTTLITCATAQRQPFHSSARSAHAASENSNATPSNAVTRCNAADILHARYWSTGCLMTGVRQGTQGRGRVSGMLHGSGCRVCEHIHPPEALRQLCGREGR